MSFVKFHAINAANGFAVEKSNKEYRVVYVERKLVDDKEKLVKVADARSNGKLLVFSSPFIADYCIRREILPLYQGAKA